MKPLCRTTFSFQPYNTNLKMPENLSIQNFTKLELRTILKETIGEMSALTAW